jgi:hypothetical protein
MPVQEAKGPNEGMNLHPDILGYSQAYAHEVTPGGVVATAHMMAPVRVLRVWATGGVGYVAKTGVGVVDTAATGNQDDRIAVGTNPVELPWGQDEVYAYALAGVTVFATGLI